jgi:uncharacterized protein
VFSVHSETVVLITRTSSGIESITDLKGRRVNVGNTGAGTRRNARNVLSLYGLNIDTDINAVMLQQDGASRALVDGKIDAFFYTARNPNMAIAKPADQVAIRIVPIDSVAVRNMAATSAHYVMTTIPSNTYTGVTQTVNTFAVKATLVTRADTSEDMVYATVKTVFDHLDELRKSHPAFANLKAHDMLTGLAAPLHPGAQAYFASIGLVAQQ